MIDLNTSIPSVTPKTIAQRCVAGVKDVLQMGDNQTYPSALGCYVDGQPAKVVQVVWGAASPDGKGHGAQDGGQALLRRVRIGFWYWLRLNVDRQGMTQQRLVQESDGVLDFMERLRLVFANTKLGDEVLTESMRYEGTGDVKIWDPDLGVVYCILTYSAQFGELLPQEETLTEEDLALALA